MAYEKLGAMPLDYMPCRYGASKLLFRGPKRDLAGRYVAFLGGTETYGKFIRQPFAALVEADLDVPCVNFGWPNAGIDVLLHDGDIIAAASKAEVTVLQVLGAQNMSNRYFTVHPRRNDRFVQASPLLRAIFPEVDFTEFHFTRHMLGCLAALAPDRFGVVRRELQDAWIARQKLLLRRIEGRILLLWIAAHAPQDRADSPGISSDPSFVTRAMLSAVQRPDVDLIEVVHGAPRCGRDTEGMAFSQFEANAAAEVPGAAAHKAAATALLPALRAAFGAASA